MSPIRSILSLAVAILLAADCVRGVETEIKFLSGTGPDDAVPWDFFCTAGRNSGAWTKIPVPSCWEQEGFGTYYYGVWRRGQPDSDPQIPREQGKYRTEFDVPAAWAGRMVRLVFEGVMTDAEVAVNGRRAGPIHQGGFYEFRYDVTRLLKPGSKNLMEVTVSKESTNESVNRAERRGDYWTFGGIFRPVFIEALPMHFIDWTSIDARAEGSFCSLVHLGAPAEAGGKVQAEIFDVQGVAIGAPLVAEYAAGATSVEVRGNVDDVKLWTAETPHLYRVRFTLLSLAGGAAPPAPRHTITQQFGFRTFEVRPGDGLYLNGAKITLKGINRHCFHPETGRTLSREQSYVDARLIKEANLNAVRCSHYPPDAHFLEACDELGLYVLDELAGWQGSYDSPTGARLIGQIVRRDANHPSILFWDNGNEGGWNTEVDGEFAKWDLQKRPVLHPWALHDAVNTKHYPKYELMTQLAAGPDIFLPTEFLHGLYDGGIGAGFRDYWDVMGNSPTCAGGFFWVFADEGVARTDRNGRIDTAGNLAPDGIVGPYHEKKGSFLVVKEIWSPVQIRVPLDERGVIPADWDGNLKLENHYDFTPLDRCVLEWRALRMPDSASTEAWPVVLDSGTMKLPAIAARHEGSIRLSGAAATMEAEVLLFTARSPEGRELWTWSWRRARAASSAPMSAATSNGPVQVAEAWRLFGFGSAPRLVAYQRKERTFEPVTVGDASHEVLRTSWRLVGEREIQLDYEYSIDADVDILGIALDFPETELKSKRWLGRGPYRVYRNRMQGGVIDVHEVAYNDPIPGQTYSFPEFKGYFRDWEWINFETTGGSLTIENASGVPFIGIRAPRDGERGVLAFPDTGLAFLDVIPAQGTKFSTPDTMGPEGRTPHVSGVKRGTVVIRFTPHQN